MFRSIKKLSLRSTVEHIVCDLNVNNHVENEDEYNWTDLVQKCIEGRQMKMLAQLPEISISESESTLVPPDDLFDETEVGRDGNFSANEPQILMADLPLRPTPRSSMANKSVNVPTTLIEEIENSPIQANSSRASRASRASHASHASHASRSSRSSRSSRASRASRASHSFMRASPSKSAEPVSNEPEQDIDPPSSLSSFSAHSSPIHSPLPSLPNTPTAKEKSLLLPSSPFDIDKPPSTFNFDRPHSPIDADEPHSSIDADEPHSSIDADRPLSPIDVDEPPKRAPPKTKQKDEIKRPVRYLAGRRLQTWRGEHPIYQPLENGCYEVVGTTKVHTPDHLKRKRRVPKKKNNSKKIFEEPSEEPTLSETFVEKSDTTREKLAKIFMNKESLNWKKSKFDDKIEHATLVKAKETNQVVGYFRFLGKCSKPPQKTGPYLTLYVLMKGSVSVKIGDEPSVLIKELDPVVVPQATNYSIDNLIDSESILLFTIL